LDKLQRINFLERMDVNKLVLERALERASLNFGGGIG
jgi:hypothetical protein